NNYHTFQPLLYQVATAGLEPDSIAYPLRKILRRQKNLIFRNAAVTRVYPDTQEIETSIGRLRYDYLVMATGSRTNYFGNELLGQKVMPLKSIQDAFNLRNFVLQRFEKALLTNDIDEREALMSFVIVGGGPTGVETAGALGELKRHILPTDYPELDLRRMQIHVVEAAGKLLGMMSPGASTKADKFLTELSVTIWLNAPVKGYDGKTVELGNGKTIRSETVIWTAGVLGAAIEGLPEESHTRNHRIKVDSFNRMLAHKNIFVIGDLACLPAESYENGHPMVAQVAIQQATRLAKNLDLLLKGKEPVAFVYKNLGDLATVGRNRAVADFQHLKIQGFIAWLLWIFVHLMNLVGFRNKVVVLINWVWNYVTYDRSIRLIFGGTRVVEETTKK
ncbi:MAG: NAD(P)/FAD-dependent oxidoreductase, partial [Candidatus Zixiibacteriota bacterium]